MSFMMPHRMVFIAMGIWQRPSNEEAG